MAINIETFSNQHGGNSFFKAIGHPYVTDQCQNLLNQLEDADAVGFYDPNDMLRGFAEMFDLSVANIAGVYVQDVNHIGKPKLGCETRPVTDLGHTHIDVLVVAAFDADRLIDHIKHLVPEGCQVLSFDTLRLPQDFLSVPKKYLSPLNFATNFAFFRDKDGMHTKIVTANYWSRYGAQNPKMWMCLFDENGKSLASWTQELAPGESAISIDSKEVREKFDLPEFAGQLFIHVLGAAGHDVVKYALDVYGDDEATLSCTHDANAWPADYYAGLPAPRQDEKVILWVQNSHPKPVPAGAIGLAEMGSDDVSWLDKEIAPFASYPLNVDELMPNLTWPKQIEIHAGKHVVRPRYEVITPQKTRHIAHPNVERVDLKPDPRLVQIGNLMGKGFILPAPILPRNRYETIMLPTPMARSQEHLPIQLKIYDPIGQELVTHKLGNLPRNGCDEVKIEDLITPEISDKLTWGHLEMIYDFDAGAEADGWLHGLFRYHDKQTGHEAETSFGAHMFNSVLTYKSEPQSYSGPAPGLSTRLFLRLGTDGRDTMCHLTYPASTPWHGTSETNLILYNAKGEEIARHITNIPCGGSYLFHYHEIFDQNTRDNAGHNAYIIIRDTTCRLFGYHGLISQGAFSLDHMFGF